jgi:hypothetical protein
VSTWLQKYRIKGEEKKENVNERRKGGKTKFKKEIDVKDGKCVKKGSVE